MSFSKWSLPSEVLKGLEGIQFLKPTKIQSAVVPTALEGHDIISAAETGSGKTAAYGIPMVSRLLNDPSAMALVMAPTRELVQQISGFLSDLSEFAEDFSVITLVGGADMQKQVRALSRQPRIVVATPGRLVDHLKRQSLSLKGCRVLVLDEGDRMLDMGFEAQLIQAIRYLPKKRQTMLFSATLPEAVRTLARKYLNKSAKSISVGPVSQPVHKIKQSVIKVDFKDKDMRAVDELNRRSGSIIIFLKTQNRTDLLWSYLREYGFEVDLIHGGRTQGQRNKAIRNFKSGKTRILCATDVAARGIDIPEVEHVINFDLPVLKDDYVHRIGRTGRNGADGEAVTFVTPDEHRAWNALAKKFKIKGMELKVEERGSKKKSRKKNAQKKSGRKKGATSKLSKKNLAKKEAKKKNRMARTKSGRSR